MKTLLILIMLSISSLSMAEADCDLRLGTTLGNTVVEFITGNTSHSKMALKETNAETLMEELINLQDMGICSDKMVVRKCVLKYTKQKNQKLLTLFRGDEKWLSWQIASKLKAQEFVKNLQKSGFCA